MHPTHDWVAQQARNFYMITEEYDGPAPAHLIRDQDQKFEGTFDAVIRGHGIKRLKLPRNSPNLNAVAERAIKTLKDECLSHFIICGQRHLDYLTQEYAVDYNELRPHSSRDCLPPVRPNANPPPAPPPDARELACEKRLGGLLRHYYWKHAA